MEEVGITLSWKVTPNNCLRQACETRGWTQREVADAIGTTAPQLSSHCDTA